MAHLTFPSKFFKFSGQNFHNPAKLFCNILKDNNCFINNNNIESLYRRTIIRTTSKLSEKMPQLPISNFFKSEKRPLSKELDSNQDDDQNNSNKKACIKPSGDDKIIEKDKVNNNNNGNNNFLEQKSLKPFKVMGGNFGLSWYKALESEFSKPYFLKLKNFVTNERKKFTVYPPEDQVFTWTLHCDINKVKVIILGQDPYHNVNQAHGLAFSVKKGVANPPSLNNIFQEVKNSYPNFEIPSHGDLTGWAKQGVLLLNACLTVQAHKANSHANNGWEQFTDAVIKYLNNNLKNRVFLLWGNYAQKKGSFINQRNHLVLKTVHPSPLSASRGFLGCEHFKKANDYLIKNNLPPIDWTKLD